MIQEATFNFNPRSGVLVGLTELQPKQSSPIFVLVCILCKMSSKHEQTMEPPKDKKVFV